MFCWQRQIFRTKISEHSIYKSNLSLYIHFLNMFALYNMFALIICYNTLTMQSNLYEKPNGLPLKTVEQLETDMDRQQELVFNMHFSNIYHNRPYNG